ncbi:TonB-dependent receptor [Sphingomonas sp. KR1UV-12]|uniref:TonB-dependent receptor n=1 Tax=Sphingomonas aurea TaxID=3063994 RepID=A0ABT9EFI0_9SPHN|nr:TonB-dependent receptor [Sphingomonas sp. KR1UV-12]MDP1025727.1 TonB-dependent receptor [Sphingomonas sp. KR1UV-12]
MLKYLLLSTALLAAPAAAQSLDQPETTATTSGDDQIVVTAARAEQSVREVGQAITVINRDEIERRQTVVIADLLATTPGVTVTRTGSIGGQTSLRIRGAEADQTLVVIDGVRVNDPSAPGGGFDFANLLSSSVERVEILRGPNSVPWGSQAIGGVVNIITRAPTEGFSARANAEYGYADQAFASAGVAGGTGALSGSLTGGFLRTDGISAAASGSERDGYRQYGANGRLGLEIAPGIGIDLRGWYAHSRAQIDGFSNSPPYGLIDADEYSKSQEIYGYAGVHADTADGRLRNRAAFTIADINRDNYLTQASAEPYFGGRGRSQRYEYQGDFRIVEQARLIAGAEHEDSRYRDGDTVEKTGITSVYGELIVKPITALTVTGGVRYDDHRRFGDRTTFGADAALALGEGTTIRASYGEGFKAPSLYQLYSSIGNEALRPETARNVDVGVSQSFLGGAARVGATWFHRNTRNQIDFDLGTFTYGNIARARAQGVEFEIALKPVEALTFTGNYSYIDSENRSPGANFGRDLLRRPRQTVTANIDYRFPFGLSVGGTVTHIGDSFDNAANTVRLDGYVLAGIRAELPIAERLSIYGRVDNLFDEDYRVVTGYGVFGRAAYGGVRVKLG